MSGLDVMLEGGLVEAGPVQSFAHLDPQFHRAPQSKLI